MVYRQNQRRKPVGRRVRRRWYLDASIGKGVPIVGGTGIKMGTNAVKRVVRREIYKQEETKMASFAGPTTSLGNGTIYTLTPLKGIVQGTGASERVGDQIYLRHIKMRTTLVSTVQGAIRIRVLALWRDDSYVHLNPYSYQSLIGSTDLFYSTSASMTHALINNKLDHQIICDKVFTVPHNGGDSVVKPERTFDVDCSVNKKVTFASDGRLKDKQLYFVLICSTTGSPQGTSDVFNPVSTDFLVSYKDS